MKVSHDDFVSSIEFKNVTFKYPNSEKYVLKNFNLKIEAGKQYALVGHSGVGKSTCIYLLERFYEPEEGEILVNGINIKEYNVQDLRYKMSLVS